MKLLVLDGNSILNRAFYGIKLLTTKDGQYTNAIYGFMNILLKLEKEQQPDEIAIAFDLKAPTFRHEMYSRYKAQRKGMPEELAAQMPVLKELLAYLGYQQVTAEGYEADDILGTLAAAGAKRGDDVELATGDRDSLQLVRPGVTVLLTTTKMGKGETVAMDEAAIREKYGIEPLQLIQTKALMGDASDNIPGVPGVGEKTAFKLIQEFESVDGVYENIDSAVIKPGQRTKLLDGKDSAYMSLKLAEIDCNVPVDTQLGAYKKQPAKQEEAAALMSKLELYSLLSRLGLQQVEAPAQPDAPKLKEVTAEPLPFALSGTVSLCATEGGWLIVQANTVYYAENGNGQLLSLLADANVAKRAFDAKPLHKLALAAGMRLQNLLFDGKLAAYLLSPAAAGYHVQRLAGEYGVPPAFSCEAYPDAAILEGLLDVLADKLAESEMTELLLTMEQPLTEVLASMELVGVQLDTQGLCEFGKTLQQELEKQLASVYEEVGYEFNLNSPKQLSEVLFDKLGLPHGKKNKSGYSTDAETLEGLRHLSPVVDTILLYRTYSKLNSTYVEGLLKLVDEDGRIRSTFNQTEARTGRLSSFEPNLQNIPVRTELGSQLRRFFVAQGGSTFADADYSQIELRILASISGDEAMQEAFRAGMDIHRATAAKVNGLPPEMVTPQLRSAAKAVNFGIIYGIGAFSLSKDIGVSVKEADAFIKNYLDNFPGVRQYMDDAKAQGHAQGYVTTLYGRRRPLPELASSNHNIRALGERMAMNTPIQGTAADIIKLAMVRVYNRLQQEGLQSRLILQVHDELIVEAVEAEVEQVKIILEEEMVHAAQLNVPLEADVHTGKTWLAAKG